MQKKSSPQKSSPQKSSPQAEALARRLQEKLTRERPRWHRWMPLVALALLGVLVLLAPPVAIFCSIFVVLRKYRAVDERGSTQIEKEV